MTFNATNDAERPLAHMTNRLATDDMSGREPTVPGATRAVEQDPPLSAEARSGACHTSAGQGWSCFKRGSSTIWRGAKAPLLVLGLHCANVFNDGA